ncbi:MAG: hypothetical protein ACTHM6_04715, partial [Tepidisphaeraceae bacterium]
PRTTSQTPGERKADIDAIAPRRPKHAAATQSNAATLREAASTGNSRLKSTGPRARKTAAKGIALSAGI